MYFLPHSTNIHKQIAVTKVLHAEAQHGDSLDDTVTSGSHVILKNLLNLTIMFFLNNPQRQISQKYYKTPLF